MGYRKATRVTNADIALCVRDKLEFTNSKDSCYGVWEQADDLDYYVVYSYGQHFPMYAYYEPSGEWYGNSGKYSRTTSSHQRCAKELIDVDRWLNTAQMREVASYGLLHAMQRKFAA